VAGAVLFLIALTVSSKSVSVNSGSIAKSVLVSSSFVFLFLISVRYCAFSFASKCCGIFLSFFSSSVSIVSSSV